MLQVYCLWLGAWCVGDGCASTYNRVRSLFSTFDRNTDGMKSTGRNVSPGVFLGAFGYTTRDDGLDMRLWALGFVLVPCRGREVRDGVGRGVVVRVAVS